MLYKVLFLVFVVGCCTATEQQNQVNKGRVRPCYLSDYHCIRDNLAANSKCSKKVKGSIPSPQVIKQFRYETPFFNASYIDNDLVVKNYDTKHCRVSEFYYNIKKDLAVLAIDCHNMVLSSTNRTYMQHNSLREDDVYSFSSTWKYPLIRMTAQISNADKMDVCNSFVFTDVAAMPTFILRPNDQKTKGFLSRDLSFLNIYEREAFFYRGQSIFRQFVSRVLCDFGCYM